VRDGENLEKLSMEVTVLNMHYVTIYIGFHVTFTQEKMLQKQQLFISL